MSTEGYIAKKKKGTGFYEELHLEALEILQKLSGAIWTDYNEHDPGVTILENITYALTEISHKIKVPIQDLLIDSPNVPLQSGDNAFFVASDILTTAPITFNDYRKVWIDQIANVKNIWIHPIDKYEGALQNIKGLLYVFVEKYEYSDNPAQEQQENERICDAITTSYHSHRNLCEDLYKVAVYKPLRLTIQLRIALSDQVDSEEILAKILHKINSYLAPEVRYYSLWKLQQEAIPTSDIFNGPHLSNGFIRDQDFSAPLTTIVIADIIKRIAQIHGVENVIHFSLQYQDPDTQEFQQIQRSFTIPKHTTALVLFPTSNQQLVFENAGISFRPDLEETRKQLSFIQALDYGKFKAASNSLNEIPIPQGKHLELDIHYPIRKQFPEVYGIGDRGISQQASPLRQAQVKQLQAYLMPFDQLMVNFLAQLRNIYTLYDVKDTNEASFFSKTVSDIDALVALIQPTDQGYDIQAAKTHWDTVLKDLNIQFDRNATERLHQVADHLLARFGETFQTYTLRKINNSSYGDAFAPQKFERQMLTAKRQLIASYASNSYSRARGFTLLQSNTDPNDFSESFIPGIFRKIAILLEIQNFGIQSLTDTITKAGIKMHPTTREIELIIREIDITTPLQDIGIITIEEITINEVIEENLQDVMHFVGDERSILNDVLQYGINPKNYTIKKDPATDLHYILYKRGTQQSNIVHICKTQDEAIEAITKAIHFLIDVSEKSEGFFVIEHLLLLPPYAEAHFGFELPLENTEYKLPITITHTSLQSCEQRDTTVGELIQLLIAKKLTYCIEQKNTEYYLAVRTATQQIIAVSKETYADSAIVQKYIDTLENDPFTPTQNQLESAVISHVYYGDQAVNETFFSFKMSCIIPSWPVRFQHQNFQQIFENTLYEHIPVHLCATTYWLDYDLIHLFEAYYFAWITTLQDSSKSKERSYQAYQLITMLQELEKQATETDL